MLYPIDMRKLGVIWMTTRCRDSRSLDFPTYGWESCTHQRECDSHAVDADGLHVVSCLSRRSSSRSRRWRLLASRWKRTSPPGTGPPGIGRKG